MKQVLWVAGAALAMACGGGGTTPGPAQPAAVALEVAGVYEVRKSVVEDSCGLGRPGDVVTNPATVRQSRGATDFVLDDHGTRNLPGSVRAGGAFDLAPSVSTVMGTIAATDTFEGGRFTTSGFTVRDTTVLERSPVAGAPAGPCRVVATWEGAKQGPPNVIP